MMLILLCLSEGAHTVVFISVYLYFFIYNYTTVCLGVFILMFLSEGTHTAVFVYLRVQTKH